jgi:TetR/AcrR family transcriptional regulator, copper-responsive repressor
MVQNPARKRGRPRAYDPDQALARARALFWDGGYAATSLDDLAEATGMNRPSLYGAFGDKRALYRQALQGYRASAMDAIKAVLRDDVPVRQAFRDLYQRAAALYLQGEHGQRGCLLISTALTESVLDAEVRALAADALTEFEGAFASRIRVARNQGELASRTDPAALARVASGILYALSIRARTGASRATLDAIIAAGIDALFPQPAPARDGRPSRPARLPQAQPTLGIASTKPVTARKRPSGANVAKSVPAK